MADFDITSLLANSAKTNANFDFSQLADSYYKGLDEAYKLRQQNAFQDPKLYGPDGQIDPYKAVQAALKAGGLTGVDPAAKVAGISDTLSKLGNTAGLNKDYNPNAPPSVYRDPQAPNSGFPPSISPTKSAPATVAPDSSPGNNPNTRGGGDQANSLVDFLTAQGIPAVNQGTHIVNLSTEISKRTGRPFDANAPLDLNNPQVRSVLSGFVRSGAAQAPQGPQVAQVSPPPAPVAPAPAAVAPAPVAPPPVAPAPVAPPPPVPGSQAPIVPTQVTTQSFRPPAAPQPADPTLGGIISQRELQLFGTPQNVLAYLQRRLTQGLQPDAAKTVQKKIDDIVEQLKYTGTQKEAGTPAPIAALEGAKTSAVENAKLYATKAAAIEAAGSKARQEIPQLELLKEQMSDPNFFSGIGEKYNLAYKQLKSAVGIDPDAAVPQEMLRKVAATNVMSSLGDIKGMGQLRNAIIGMAKEAMAAPNTSVPANKLLTEIAIRTHQRNDYVSDQADQYKASHGGNLDAGFDSLIAQHDRQNPLFSPAEINNWRSLIGQSAKTAPAPSATQPASKRYTRSEADAAVASGALKKGDTFFDNNGIPRKVQ